MDRSCATCAKVFGSDADPLIEKAIFPGRDLHCCGRAICARCLNQNKRYETYCPYCQITTTPSALPQGLRDPPAYSTLETAGNTSYSDSDDPPAYSSTAGHELLPEKQHKDEPAPDVLHFLSKDDSIHSLSLAYGVPANALRKTNNVYSDGLLQGRRTVLIPGEYYKGGVSLSPRPIEGEEEEARKTMVRRWMVGVKCAEYDVALLYLKNSDWDLDAAVEAYLEDEQWEKEHPLHKDGKNPKRPKDVGMRRFVGSSSR